MKKQHKPARPKGLIQRADKLVSRVTGREHNYKLTLSFRPGNWPKGSIPLTLVKYARLTYRGDLQQQLREMKRFYGPGFMKGIREIGVDPSNGKLAIEDLTYLGRH